MLGLLLTLAKIRRAFKTLSLQLNRNQDDLCILSYLVEAVIPLSPENQYF